jgi:peroxiredoxin Q/BCP
MVAEINKTIEPISFESTNPSLTSFDQLKGQWVIVYFYPKDNTSGCTKEAQDFSASIDKFKHCNTTVIGVSRDSLASHHKFIEKINIPYSLISDSDEKLCHYFDVIKEKKLYGKTYMGIERSTFIIDDQGVLREAVRNVKVSGHVLTLLDQLHALQGEG